MRQEADRRFGLALDEVVEAGVVDGLRARRMRHHFESSGPHERLRTIQRLATLHPDGLQISQTLLQGLGEVDDPVEALARVHAHRVPDLSARETERMLADAGVPEAERRRWMRLQGEARLRIQHKLMKDHRIVPPTAMARHLQQLGVEPTEVRGAFRSDRKLDALRALYRKHGLAELEFEDYWRRARRSRAGITDRASDVQREAERDRRFEAERLRREGRVPPPVDRRGDRRDG